MSLRDIGLGALIGGWGGTVFWGHVYVGPMVSAQLDLLVIEAAEAIVAGTEIAGYEVAVTTTKAVGQVALAQGAVVAVAAGAAGGLVGGAVEGAVTPVAGKPAGVAAGVAAGAATGAAVGAAIGAVLGGVGAGPGAVIGGVAGAIGGLIAGLW